MKLKKKYIWSIPNQIRGTADKYIAHSSIKQTPTDLFPTSVEILTTFRPVLLTFLKTELGHTTESGARAGE